MTDHELEGDGTVTSGSTGYSSSTSRSSDISYEHVKSGKLIQAKAQPEPNDSEPKSGSPYLKQHSRNRYEWGKRIRLILALAGILGIVGVIFLLSFYLPDEPQKDSVPEETHTLLFKSLGIGFISSTFEINNTNGDVAISANFKEPLASPIGRTITEGNTSLTVQGTTYRLSVVSWGTCLNITWFGKSGKVFEDCFDASDTHWYGAAELYHQAWPLEKGSIKMAPFLSQDLLANKENREMGFGGVLEPYFLNSKGGGIYVDRNVKLHVSINENNNRKLCIKADNKGYPLEAEAKNITLAYTICVADNVKAAHTLMRKTFIDVTGAGGVPDVDMLSKPVWSTWARYKKDINQGKIESFVDEIAKYGMQASHIEIDDKYSTDYGDFKFDPDRFPTPNAMIHKIRGHKFRVTVWVYPFSNIGSRAMLKGLPYWVQTDKNLMALVRWWNGVGSILDTTNPAATKWFVSELKAFQAKYKINSFKFDAGEVSYLPKERKLNTTLANPNYYSTLYVKMASSFRGLAECRVGYHSQKFPLFVRMIDRSSTWSAKNGLKSLISATLTFGLLGYPFVLPDMVGGNADKGLPEKELYIRWAQLSVFLPAIQFSITPWDYDQETVSLVKKALQIKYSLRSEFMQFVKEAQYGVPIIRPLWWFAPSDPIALKEDTEFMYGSKYLVAPVIEKGAKIRQVYLPAGTWSQQFGKYQRVISKGEYFNITVALKDILYFKVIKL